MPSIYGLFDTDGNLRYIGKANDPAQRLRSHMRERRRKTPLYDWLKKHGQPEMRVLEEGCTDWRASERRLIAEARLRGDRLLNIAEGGDEPHCPPEVRARNGANTVKAIQSDPVARFIWNAKRTLGKALKDGCVRNSTRAKMREAARLRPDMFGAWASISDREEAVT